MLKSQLINLMITSELSPTLKPAFKIGIYHQVIKKSFVYIKKNLYILFTVICLNVSQFLDKHTLNSFKKVCA